MIKKFEKLTIILVLIGMFVNTGLTMNADDNNVKDADDYKTSHVLSQNSESLYKEIDIQSIEKEKNEENPNSNEEEVLKESEINVGDQIPEEQKDENIILDDALEDQKDTDPEVDFSDGEIAENEKPIENENVENDGLEEVLPTEKEEVVPVELTNIVDGLTISVLSDSLIIPKGSSLSVRSLSESDNKVYIEAIKIKTGTALSSFKAFDINIVDETGNIIQPAGSVEVVFSGLDFIQLPENVNTYHLDALFGSMNLRRNATNGSLRADKLSAEVTSEEVSFSTNHFSIYGVGEVARATYIFKDEGIEVDTQIVLDGELLSKPAVPIKKDHKRFLGWQIDGESNLLDFISPVTVGVGLGENEIKTVNATYEDVYYVYFKYNDEIIVTKEVGLNEATNDDNVPLVVIEDGKTLSHWSTSIAGVEFDFSNVITDDTILYAVLADRHKVTFDSQGGSTILPKYLENNAPLGEIEVPVRAGYEFINWNTEADGSGTTYANTTAIGSSIKLFAIWQAKPVNYSIVYWQENADDTNYTYKETVTASGLTGTTVTLFGSEISNTKYPYFSYKEYDNGKPIKGDGSTVVNVFYSRNQYKVEFNLNTSYYNRTLTIGENTYNRNTLPRYFFIAKYESNISDLWPTASNINSNNFYGWSNYSSGSGTLNVSKRLELTSDLISTTGTKTFYGSWASGLSEFTLHYMIESLEGYVSGAKNFDSKWYLEDMAYSQKANSSGNWNAKQLPGVTNVGKKLESKNNQYFFYYRNSYVLNFYNPTLLDKDVTSKFGSSIAGQNYTPARPAGVSVDYVFSGWYENPEGAGNPYDFTNKTMPEHNLALYSKWAPPTYQVGYYETQDGDGELKTIDDIPAGDPITVGQLTKEEVDGAEFAGWYWYLSGVFVPYDFNTPVINNDYVLYPVWKGDFYTVTYMAGGASGSVPVDNEKYILGSAANVLSPNDLIGPEDKVFLGYKKDETSKLYYPNDKLTITGNMTLTAQWGEIVPDTAIVYEPNGGEGVPHVVDPFKNNDNHTVLENAYINSGYIFTGWNTRADGSGGIFRPGDVIVVGNPTPNILYAQWFKIINITVTANSDIREYTGALQTVSGYETPEGLFSGHILSGITASGSGKNVGNYPVTFTGTPVIMDGTDDVTENYAISLIPGNLEITKKAVGIPVTVTANSDIREYTGALQTVSGYETPEGLFSGHILSGITASGSGKNVGNYPVTFTGTPVIMDGTDDVTENYEISLVPGNLEITPASFELLVTAASDSKVYDGTPLFKDEAVVVGLQIGHTMSDVTVTGSQTQVGSSANIASNAIILDEAGADVTVNYVITYVDGILTVRPRPIALVPDMEITKVGTYLDSNSDGIVSVGDRIDYVITVTNTGDLDLGNLVISDPLLDLEITEDSLVVGEAKSYSGSYIITELDIDAEFVTNRAKVVTELNNGQTLTKEVENTVNLGSPKINVTGNKVWVLGPEIKPTIELQLYQNGVAYGNPVELVDGQTSYAWIGLDKVDNEGINYIYTIDEVSTPENYDKLISEDGLTVTNVFFEVAGDFVPDDPAEKPGDITPPTGINNYEYLYAMTLILSSAGLVVLGKRKEEEY